MTKEELEQQAKEYGMTVSEIKEYRKHIKPFLRFAIKYLIPYKGGRYYDGLCWIAYLYCQSKNMPRWGNPIEDYLTGRLSAVRPKDAVDGYWYDITELGSVEKRIAFCRQQLKLVKP
jgi:hypothetical protein